MKLPEPQSGRCRADASSCLHQWCALWCTNFELYGYRLPRTAIPRRRILGVLSTFCCSYDNYFSLAYHRGDRCMNHLPRSVLFLQLPTHNEPAWPEYGKPKDTVNVPHCIVEGIGKSTHWIGRRGHISPRWWSSGGASPAGGPVINIEWLESASCL